MLLFLVSFSDFLTHLINHLIFEAVVSMYPLYGAQTP